MLSRLTVGVCMVLRPMSCSPGICEYTSVAGGPHPEFGSTKKRCVMHRWTQKCDSTGCILSCLGGA